MQGANLAIMNIRDYHKVAGNDGLQRLADKAGTSFDYIRQMMYGFRRPSVTLAERLVEASDGQLDFVALLKNKRPV